MFSGLTICVITGHFLFGVTCHRFDVRARGIAVHDGISLNKTNPKFYLDFLVLERPRLQNGAQRYGIQLFHRENVDSSRDDSSQIRNYQGSSPLAPRDCYNECLVTLVSSAFLCQAVCKKVQCYRNSPVLVAIFSVEYL